MNQAVDASIGRKGDLDWYHFVLDSNALFRPELLFPELSSPSEAYAISLQREGQELFRYSAGGKDSGKQFAYYVLPAGDYMLKVENTARVPQDYQIVCRTEAAGDIEEEPNNSEAEADEPGYGKDITGILGSRDEADFYHFTVEGSGAEPSVIHLSLAAMPQGEAGTSVKITLRRDNAQVWPAHGQGGNILAAGGDPFTLKVGLPAGEYYWKVEPESWGGPVIYRLKLSLEE